jgi:hypothetical protein
MPLHQLLAATVALVFVALGLWHFHMAYARPAGGAVPSGTDGEPLFVPSRASTLSVGLILWLLGATVAAAGGIIPSALPAGLLRGACWVLALGLLARAIGEFRYVGFFKRVRGSRFATLDTWVYSPLCLALALAVAVVAAHEAG